MHWPHYLLARWPHGWTLNAPPNKNGVPITSFQEVLSVFEPSAVLDPGISHHLRTSGHPEVVEAIVTPAEGETWREEIRVSLLPTTPEERWWRGTDTGSSSSAIFAVFCGPRWQRAARDRGRGACPRDSADLGRCIRLLAEFPEWEKNLQKVAEAYPTTAWAKVTAQWETLKAATPKEQSATLRDIEKC